MSGNHRSAIPPCMPVKRPTRALPQASHFIRDGSAGFERLSGGMRQRVALARVLFGGPALGVLDAPSSSLTRQARAPWSKIQFMKHQKRTVVLVMHRPQILAHVDNLLVMGPGRRIADGPRDEVIADKRGNKVATA